MKYKTIAACALVLVLLTLRAPMNAETLNEERFIDMDIENSILWKQETLLAAAQPIIDFYADWNYGWISAIHYDEKESLEIIAKRMDGRYDRLGINVENADLIVFSVDLYLYDSMSRENLYLFPQWYWVSVRDPRDFTWTANIKGDLIHSYMGIPSFSYIDRNEPLPDIVVKIDEAQAFGLPKTYDKPADIKYEIGESRIYDRKTLLDAARAVAEIKSHPVWSSVTRVLYDEEDSLFWLETCRENGFDIQNADCIVFWYNEKNYIPTIWHINSYPERHGDYYMAVRDYGSDAWRAVECLSYTSL
jgi:hypothetical protein